MSIASITFFYEYQKTPIYNNIALIEIGHNYSLNDDLFYEQKYIESIEQLIVNLKLNFLRKPNKDNKVQNVAFKKISENILSLQAQSLSIDDGNYFINSIIDTTINRHKKLMIQLTDYSKVKEDASKLLHSADHFILCIDQRRQRLIGFACAETRDTRIGCMITLLWVAVDARRHGIATQIMLRMMGYGRSKNMSTAKV